MKKISVLIVDDSEMDSYLLERVLEATSYEIVTFTKINGLEAVEFIEQYDKNKAELGDDFPPMIIFLDINMPLMNGLEFLEKYADIRKSNQDLATSVVMMFTSSKNPKDIQASLDYEFVSGYIIKGEYTAEYLDEVIGNLFK
jgi:CheY-like chemotaxis protein